MDIELVNPQPTIYMIYDNMKLIEDLFNFVDISNIKIWDFL
jgi:hypothetical protein